MIVPVSERISPSAGDVAPSTTSVIVPLAFVDPSTIVGKSFVPVMVMVTVWMADSESSSVPFVPSKPPWSSAVML